MVLGEMVVILYTIAMFAVALYVSINDDMAKGEYDEYDKYKEDEWQ